MVQFLLRRQNILLDGFPKDEITLFCAMLRRFPDNLGTPTRPDPS